MGIWGFGRGNEEKMPGEMPLGDIKVEKKEVEKVETSSFLSEDEKRIFINKIMTNRSFSQFLSSLDSLGNKNLLELIDDPRTTSVRVNDDPDIVKAYNQGLVLWFNSFSEGKIAISLARDLGIPVNLKKEKDKNGLKVKKEIDLTVAFVRSFDDDQTSFDEYKKIVQFAEENDLPIDYKSEKLKTPFRKTLDYVCILGVEDRIIELLELNDKYEIISKQREPDILTNAFLEISRMDAPKRLYSLFNVMKKRDSDINYEMVLNDAINQMLSSANGFGIEAVEDIAKQNNIEIGNAFATFSNSAKMGIRKIFTENNGVSALRMEKILSFVKRQGLNNKELMEEKGEKGVDFDELITKLFVQEQNKYLETVTGLVIKGEIVEMAKVFESNDIKLDYKQMFEDYVEKALDNTLKAESKVDLLAVSTVAKHNDAIVENIDDREIDLDITNDRIVEKASKVAGINLYIDLQEQYNLDIARSNSLKDFMYPYFVRYGHMKIDLSGNMEDVFKFVLIQILENEKGGINTKNLNYLRRIVELIERFELEIDYSDKSINDAFARTILRSGNSEEEDWIQHDLAELYKKNAGRELDFKSAGVDVLCETVTNLRESNPTVTTDQYNVGNWRSITEMSNNEMIGIDFTDERIIKVVQDELVGSLSGVNSIDQCSNIYEFIKNKGIKVDFQNGLVKDILLKSFGRGLSNNDELTVAKVIEIHKDNNVEIDLLDWGKSILTNIANTQSVVFPNCLELAWRYGVEVRVEGEAMNEAVAKDIYDKWQASFMGNGDMPFEKVERLIEFYENERGAIVDLNSKKFISIFERALGMELRGFSKISKDDSDSDSAFTIADLTQEIEVYMQYIEKRGIKADIDKVLNEQCQFAIFNYIEGFFNSELSEKELKKMTQEAVNFISQMRCDTRFEKKEGFFNAVYVNIYNRAITYSGSGFIIKRDIKKSNVEVLDTIERLFGEIDFESEQSEEFNKSMLGKRYEAPHFGKMDFAPSDVINHFQLRIRNLLEDDKFDDAIELHKYGSERVKSDGNADKMFSNSYFAIIINALEENNREKADQYLDKIDKFEELIDQNDLKDLRNELEFGESYNLLYSEISMALDHNEESRSRIEAFQTLEELKGRSAVFERIMEELVEADEWSQGLIQQFTSLEGAVGFETALNYLGEHNRHDALLIEQYLGKFYDLSHLTSEGDLEKKEIEKETKKRRKSLKNLLSQAPMDSSLDYDGNDSRQGLVNALRNYRSEWFDEFEAEGYFDNIKTFKKQVKIKEKMTPELLSELARIEKEDPVLFAYADKLIMHPTVSVDAIIEFLGNPKAYFERHATHADKRLQRELQAGQWCELSDGFNFTIDLTHAEVRDAIVKGQIDEMSPFKPYKYEFEHVVQNQKMAKKQEKYDKLVEKFENDFDGTLGHMQGLKKGFMVKEVKVAVEVFKLIEYIDTDDLISYTKKFADALMKGAGSQKMKLKKEDFALIENEEDLIEVWSRILQYKDVPWKDFRFLASKGKLKLNDKNLRDASDSLESVDEVKNLEFDKLEDEQKNKLKYSIIQVVKDQAQKYSGKKLIITAEVLAHSDPRYATIGDDTTCCMPFDDGKHGAYMAYPGCGAMTISFRDPQQDEGDARIAIQSVLTLDKKLEGVSFASNYKKLMMPGQMRQVFDDGILSKYYESEDVIACDNVEGHRNYIQNLISSDNSVIEKIYKKFFRAYRKNQKEFDDKEVVIGMGYSDYLTNLPTTPNEYFLQSLVTYSDKTASNVYSLLEGEKGESVPNAGVRELTWRDTIPAAYLQEKTYTAGTNRNETHVEGITNIQKMLVASNLQSVRDDTNSLTIGHFDELSGSLDGYTIGYIVNDRSEDGKKKIYSHETVVDPEAQGKGVGRELFTTFLMKIIGDPKLNKLPIVTNLRESTSYEMIKARKHVIEDLGYEVTELENVHHMAGEKFYTFEFTPKGE
jgi:hypothetical protein